MRRKSAAAIQPAKEAAPIRLLAGGDLFDRMPALYDSIARRAFEAFEGRGGVDGHDLEDWFGAESEVLHPLHLDIAESEDAVTVHAEVPGFSAKELEVSLEPRRIAISGKRESNEERKAKKTIYKEYCSDQIFRAIDLPAEVDSSRVTATLKDGVLELVMRKVATARKVQSLTSS
jgi:HSP20 family protein